MKTRNLTSHRPRISVVGYGRVGGGRRLLEGLGSEVLVAAAQKVKGLAPLACKTDRIDAQVLAVLSHRDLVPAIWLPDPRVRSQREQGRFRLHLVTQRSMLSTASTPR